MTSAQVEVERLRLRARITITPEPAGSADLRWCVDRYLAELDERLESGFDPARSRRVDLAELSPPAGFALVARLAGDPVGCGAVQLLPGGVAEIKRMWVAPRVRGLGLGRRLLGELEERAADSGARVARLDTNASLTEAVAMYRRAGYREVPAFNDEPYADHWFEKPL